MTTLAGSPPGGDRDGTGSDAGLHGPNGITVGAGGTAWVADRDNASVRRIDTTGRATTVVRFEGGYWPSAVAVDGTGRVLVALEGLDHLCSAQTRVIAVTQWALN